jgi:hypothetical protein
MFTTFFLSGALFVVGMTGLASGQDLPHQTKPQASEADVAPGGGYKIGLNSGNFRQPDGAIRQDLVAAIGSWLSVQFSLPPIEYQPVIKLVPAQTIVTVRYPLLAHRGPSNDYSTPLSRQDTVAVYNDTTQTIYLAEDWNGSTPAEQSILVHEMVHHFQNMLGLRYECGQAREELAYRAQESWLGLFGHDLATDFELDPFSLLVKTKCFY